MAPPVAQRLTGPGNPEGRPAAAPCAHPRPPRSPGRGPAADRLLCFASQALTPAAGGPPSPPRPWSLAPAVVGPALSVSDACAPACALMLRDVSSIAIAFLLSACSLVSVSGTRSVALKAKDYGDKWPFTVGEGFLSCEGAGVNAVLFTSGGVVYALNGSAIGKMNKGGTGWVDIQKIRKAHPDSDIYGTKFYVSIPGAWFQEGLRLCPS